MEANVKIFGKLKIFFLVLALTGTLTACSEKNGINDTLNEFEYSARNMNIDAMLNCIDPMVSDPIHDVVSIYHLVTRETIEDTIRELIKSVFDRDFEPSEFLTGMSFEEREIKITGRKGVVRCRLVVEIKGETFGREIRVLMHKVRDRWYIAGVEEFYED